LAPDISDDHVAFILKCNGSMKNKQYRSLEATYWCSGNSADSQKDAGVLQWQWNSCAWAGDSPATCVQIRHSRGRDGAVCYI